jgi:hypothetical protein
MNMQVQTDANPKTAMIAETSAYQSIGAIVRMHTMPKRASALPPNTDAVTRLRQGQVNGNFPPLHQSLDATLQP